MKKIKDDIKGVANYLENMIKRTNDKINSYLPNSKGEGMGGFKLMEGGDWEEDKTANKPNKKMAEELGELGD